MSPGLAGDAATSEPVPEAIGRYFHGVNHEDWNDFRGIWHDGAVVEVVGGRRVQGWDEILPYYVSALSNFPVHHDDPYGIHVAGDTITVEIAFTGETVDGVSASFEAVDVFTLEGGRVRRLTTWYDLDRVVGFLRRRGAPGRRLRTLVRHAASSSPFYRRLFDELGLDPDVVAADLAKLPATRLPGAVVDELVAVPEAEISCVVAGAHGTIPLTRADVAAHALAWKDVLELAGVGPGDTVGALIPTPGLAEGVARARARFAFTGDPEALDGTVVVVSSDRGTATRDGRARLLAVVEFPETGVVASPCTSGTLHAHARSQIVEIVDGELVVTPLGARALPLLRFATGISAAWLGEPCPCGSDLPGLFLQEAPPP